MCIGGITLLSNLIGANMYLAFQDCCDMYAVRRGDTEYRGTMRVVFAV